VDSIKILQQVLHLAKFGEWTSGKLGGIRFAHESDEETLKRVIKQARKTICPDCRGHKTSFVGGDCRHCHGTGERAYDPFIPMVKKAMED